MTFIPILNLIYLCIFGFACSLYIMIASIRLEAKPDFKYKKYFDKFKSLVKNIYDYLMKEF